MFYSRKEGVPETSASAPRVDLHAVQWERAAQLSAENRAHTLQHSQLSLTSSDGETTQRLCEVCPGLLKSYLGALWEKSHLQTPGKATVASRAF